MEKRFKKGNRHWRQISSQRNSLRIFFEAFEGMNLKVKIEEAYIQGINILDHAGRGVI